MARTGAILTFIFAITLVAQISPLQALDSVPLFVWTESDNLFIEPNGANPFEKTSPEKLEEILNNILKNHPPVLVLLFDSLCMEDITPHREALSKVITGGSYKYIPAAERPISTLKELSSYNQSYDADVESISDGQMVFKRTANFDNLGEMVEEIKEQSPNLVVIMTGYSCNCKRSDRIKRDTATSDSTPFIVSTERVLFYSSKPLYFRTNANETYFPLTLLNKVEAKNRGTGTSDSPLILSVHLRGGSISKMLLEFTFTVNTAGYYTLSSVNQQMDLSQNVLLSNTEVLFPFNFSYHCSQNVFFNNGSLSLNIENLQVQIDGKNDTFNDAYDCVGFTTIPIWTGLFVTAILALIMIWALTMMMDIRTMDRFDDPKGKTITISAQE